MPRLRVETPLSSQNQFPRFLNKVMTEAMVCTLGHELEPCFSVDVSRLYKDALGPEHEFLVTTASSEANTLFDETRTQPQATCLRFDQQESEFGNCFTTLHNKNGTNDFPIHLRDPAAFSCRIVVVDEIRHDLSNKRLETLVPAILLSIQDTMPVRHPPHVAWFVRAEKKGFGIFEAFREHALYSLHSLQQALLLLFAQVIEHF